MATVDRMKKLLRKQFLIFFSSLILALPITNALHFVIVDHSISTEAKSKKQIIHHCDDYLLYPVFSIDIPNFEIEKPQWIEERISYSILYIYHYHFNLITAINNKGPPYVNTLELT